MHTCKFTSPPYGFGLGLGRTSSNSQLLGCSSLRRGVVRQQHKCGARRAARRLQHQLSSPDGVELLHCPNDGNEHHAGDGSCCSCRRLASSACASFFAMTEDSAAAVENGPPPRPHWRPQTGSNSFMCGDARGCLPAALISRRTHRCKVRPIGPHSIHPDPSKKRPDLLQIGHVVRAVPVAVEDGPF